MSQHNGASTSYQYWMGESSSPPNEDAYVEQQPDYGLYTGKSKLKGLGTLNYNNYTGSYDLEEEDDFLNQKSLFSRRNDEKFDFDLHHSIEDISLSEDDGISMEDDDLMEKNNGEEEPDETLAEEYKTANWNIISAEDQNNRKQESPKEKHVHHHHFLDIENPDTNRDSLLEAIGLIEQRDELMGATSHVDIEEKSEIAKFIENYCSFTEQESKEKSPKNRLGQLDLSYASDDGLKQSGKVQVMPKVTSPNISHLLNVSSIAETSEQLKQIDSMISKLLNGYSPDKKNSSYTSPQYPQKHNVKNESAINLLNQYSSPMKFSPTKQVEKKTLTKPVPFNFSLEKRKRATMDKSLEYDNTKMAECTFHPSISSYNSGVIENEPFIERVSRWKEKVENDKKTMEKALTNSIKKDCSFKPEINPICMKKLDDDVGVHDRLYVDSFRVLDKIEENRFKLNEDEFKRTCTFKPKITSTTAQPKYLEPKKLNESKKEDQPKDEYTFKPNTLDPKVSNQASIKYLSEDPFLRLSRRLVADDNVIKKKTQNKEQTRPKSTGKFKPTYSFEEFLKRQNQTLSKKEERIDFIRQNEFAYKPSLNEKSMELFHGLDHDKRNEILQKHKKKEKSVS